MNSIKVCEYSRSRSFHDDLILQDQASGERSQDHWSSGFVNDAQFNFNYMYVWLLINCFVLYVWDYFGLSFMFGAISDIKTKQNN